MSTRFVRVYQKLDVHQIKQHLLIYGDLSGQCAHCQTMDIRLDQPACPSCGAEFRYIAFRNIKDHLPKVQELYKNRPQVILVDYDDYKRHLGALKAEEFLR